MKFIGPKKIKSIKTSKRKTYMGNEVKEVKFETGDKKEYPTEMLENIVKKETHDLTELRDIAVKPIASKVKMLLIEAELTLEDIDYTLALVAESINENVTEANKKYWGGKLKAQINLMDIEQKLKAKI